MSRADGEEGEYRSKSQVKRELSALQDLGAILLDVADTELERLPVSDELRAAVRAARGFRREALRRQIQYIGVLMRREDEAALRTALEHLQQRDRQSQQAFHQAEQWRDALLEGNEQLIGELGERFPDLDRQHLRQLVRNALHERERGAPPKSARLLFRYLHQLLAES